MHNEQSPSLPLSLFLCLWTWLCVSLTLRIAAAFGSIERCMLVPSILGVPIETSEGTTPNDIYENGILFALIGRLSFTMPWLAIWGIRMLWGSQRLAGV